jgi:hypothetical protein
MDTLRPSAFALSSAILNCSNAMCLLSTALVSNGSRNVTEWFSMANATVLLAHPGA